MFIRLRDGLDVRLRTAEKATEYFNRPISPGRPACPMAVNLPVVFEISGEV
jgi:hypothetical protein